MRDFDYHELTSVHWDSEIVGLVAQIHEFKGRQELYLKQNPSALEKLIDIAKVQSTEASNRIEGIVSTNTRIGQLCKEKTTPKNRDEEEILGYRDALNTIMKAMNIFPFNPISYYSFTETYINTPKSLLAADSKTHRISLLRHMATVRRQYDSFPFLLMRLPRQWTAFARTLIE